MVYKTVRLKIGVANKVRRTVAESGNPFFLMALQHVNRMRRLMKYRAQIDHARLVEQCTEHLEILDLLERGDVADASDKMRKHLSGALKRKSPLARSWARDSY